MILLSMNCSIITFKYSFQVSKKRNKRCKDWQFLILSYIKDRLLKTSKSVGFARCLREGICHRDLIIDCFYKNILWLLPCPNLLFNFHFSMTRIFLTFPIRCFLSHQKIRNTTKVIAFQSSAANINQLYVTNEA